VNVQYVALQHSYGTQSVKYLTRSQFNMCFLLKCVNFCVEEFLRLTYRDIYSQINDHNIDRLSFSYINRDMLYEIPNPIVQQPVSGKFSISYCPLRPFFLSNLLFLFPKNSNFENFAQFRGQLHGDGTWTGTEFATAEPR
jgi:hypothetical protein